jgi:hypothetical protein
VALSGPSVAPSHASGALDAWEGASFFCLLLELEVSLVIRAVDQEKGKHLTRAAEALVGLPHVRIGVRRGIIAESTVACS